jgi:uncharacterized protein with ACT and thioredoxin-like domain
MLSHFECVNAQMAGRIASELGNVVLAQQYFNKHNSNEKDEASVYYAAKAYLDNQQLNKSWYSYCQRAHLHLHDLNYPTP